MFTSSAPSANAETQQPPRPFEKGRPGNSAGRVAKPVDVGELCRRYAPRAVRALVRQLGSDDAQASVAAAEVLLAHAFGKPVQHHALYVPKIAVECRSADSAADHANGEDAKASRAWDA